jgi:cyclic pyranopterin monophosphate synthase
VSGLTHIDADGRARMVDVSAKPATVREAVAAGRVLMAAETLALVREGRAKKGDVRATAELAGVMAAKRTADLIPLCHPLQLSSVRVEVREAEGAPALEVVACVKTTGPTGVEMEALTAVSVACLTLYDMLKAADRGMTIEGVRLLEKSGGASGDWRREGA